jgi:phosphate-selective porin OprO/OprP
MRFRRVRRIAFGLVLTLFTVNRPGAAQGPEDQIQILIQKISALEKRIDQLETELAETKNFAPGIATTDVGSQIESLDQSIRIAERRRELDQEAFASRTAAAPVVAVGTGGFTLQSPNGDYRLTFGLAAQADSRFSLDKPNPITNTFTLRKIRPTFTGRVSRYFDYKVMPDFGNGTAVVQDAYFDIRFSPKFRLRTGKDKTPIGYEVLISDNFLIFPERSLASLLLPNRDIGVQAQGDLLGNKLFYAGGIFNGIPDGSSVTSELDTNDSKDFAGRVVLQPFRSASTPAGALNGLGFQVGGSTGRQGGALPTFKTSVGQTFFSYASTSAANGDRRRVSPALFYYYKAFGGFAEYMRSTQSVSRPGVATAVTNEGWNVTGTYLLTGEPAGERGVQPRNSFDPAAGRWGALQLVGRFTQLTMDGDVFSLGLASATASRRAKSFTVGANWYPNLFVKIYGTYERTIFQGLTSRPAENVILVRSQIAF